MAKVLYQSPGIAVADMMTLIARVMGWNTTDAEHNTRIEQAITAAGQACLNWDGRDWWFQHSRGSFSTKTLTMDTVANSGAARATNVSTVTTTANHSLGEGQYVSVSGCTDSDFDGVFRIASISAADAFTYTQDLDDTTTDGGDASVYVCSYPLRKVNVNSMSNLSRIRKVTVDGEYALSNISRDEWIGRMDVFPATVGKTLEYCLFDDVYQASGGTYTNELYMGLWPIPSDEYTIQVDYTRRHSVITDGASGSYDASLLVPAEFHYPIYVEGAIYLLKKQTLDPSLLQENQAFQQAIMRLAMSRPTEYDADDYFPDARTGSWPHNRRVWANGTLIEGEVSL